MLWTGSVLFITSISVISDPEWCFHNGRTTRGFSDGGYVASKASVPGSESRSCVRPVNGSRWRVAWESHSTATVRLTGASSLFIFFKKAECKSESMNSRSYMCLTDVPSKITQLECYRSSCTQRHMIIITTYKTCCGETPSRSPYLISNIQRIPRVSYALSPSWLPGKGKWSGNNFLA